MHVNNCEKNTFSEQYVFENTRSIRVPIIIQQAIHIQEDMTRIIKNMFVFSIARYVYGWHTYAYMHAPTT